MNDDKTIEVYRVIDASPAEVWRELSHAQAVAETWGAPYMTCELHKHDFRQGGRWHYTMTTPDGHTFPDEGTFTEIVPRQKLVRSIEFGEDHPAAAMKSVVTTSTLEPVSGGTLLGNAPARGAPLRKHPKLKPVSSGMPRTATLRWSFL